MTIYENIGVTIADKERLEDYEHVHDIDILVGKDKTESIKAYGLTDLQYAHVLNVFKMLDKKRFKEQ